MTTLDSTEKNSPIYYSELELLNLAILMCLENDTTGIKNILYTHDYRIISIDRSISTTKGGTVKYDICLTSPKKEMTIGVEIKGNRATNIDTEQLDRYINLDKKEFLYLNAIPTSNLDLHQMNTLLLTNSSRVSSVREKLNNLGYNFSLLGLDADNFSVSIDEIQPIDLDLYNDISSNSNIISNNRPPLIIKFDKESTDTEIATEVIPEIFKFILEKRETFKVDEIIENTYCSVPNLLNIVGSDIRSSVNKKIKQCLRELSNNELKGTLTWDGTEKQWIIKNINFSNPQKIGEKLKTVHDNFIARKNNYSTTEANIDQLSLFDDDMFSDDDI